MKRLPRDMRRLAHIFDYCTDIMQTVERFGADFEVFRTDNAYKNSVLMFILQIGELEHGLSDEFKDENANAVRWKDIRGMRNIIAHRYGELDLNIIWRTVCEDIPVLKAFCDAQLRPYDDDEAEDDTQPARACFQPLRFSDL